MAGSSTKTELIRDWAHAPWHSWIKSAPAWLDLLADVLTRLPEPAVSALLAPERPLILLPPVEVGRITRLTALPQGTHGLNILQLEACLLNRPRHEALGVLAHELAHICGAAVTLDELENDLEADRVAASWGFGPELHQALATDLGESHVRTERVSAGLNKAAA